ncbi:hypothetical protein KEM56_006920 [Ascosphaera pollenicola]|nr:hypothetical protein KEM56_006920 [Ascosphaera pollenicola]
MGASTLATALAAALPEGTSLVVRHIRTAPVASPALFPHPPGSEDEPTTCERHFLVVSVPSQPKKGDSEVDGTASSKEGELFAFAIEVYVYTTESLTVVFVSKADTTGYLQRACSSSGPRPHVRALSTTFLSHIISLSQVPGKRLLVSLFARAQHQYIFPGSATNGDKHILDDRALVKWWCRVFDPILRIYEPETHGDDTGIVQQATSTQKAEQEKTRASATAYLVVPGCDRFETRNFFPPTARLDPATASRWKNLYPLRQVCQNPAAPPRCLIPRFPDDPKARYLEELDSEISASKSQSQVAQGSNEAAEWRSVRTLDQFWELMAYRQECSSGRLVGFLWMVINPPGMVNDTSSVHRQVTSDPAFAEGTTKDTAYSPETRLGEFVLSDTEYIDLVRYIEDQDFGDVEISTTSTDEVIKKLSDINGKRAAGVLVTGLFASTDQSIASPQKAAQISDLSGLIRKRKAVESVTTPEANPASKFTDAINPTDTGCHSSEKGPVEVLKPAVNVLDSSFIRKKKKNTGS